MAVAELVRISDAQKRQYVEQGFFILEAVIPPEHIAMLRDECAKAIEKIHAEMDRLGTDTLGIAHRDSRYFISSYKDSNRVQEFLFSDLMANVCRATLGETAYLFFEQYVVKAAERGMKFSWHQDSGYVPYEHRPYLTCWCTLDDVTEENGTVYVLPYDRAGTRSRREHTQEAGSNDLVGYFGDDPGIPVIAPAGSIAVFASTVFHRSGTNTTDRMRRIYLAQYSAEPLNKPGSDEPLNLAVPFVVDGKRVR